MTEFVILSRVDMHHLCDDKPVIIWINGKPYTLCTDEYFEKQAGNTAESRECMKNENQIAKDTLHKAIDNTKIVEDVYPNLRKELHEAVDSADMRGEADE